MKKIAAIAIILLTGIIVSSFVVPTNWEVKKVNRLYSVNIPSYFGISTDLNDEASLQLENIDKEMYLIVIDEDKQEFKEAVNELMEETTFTDEEMLDVYAYLQFTTFATDDDFDNNLQYLEINGLKARQLDIVTSYDEYDVYYKMSCYESDKNFFFLVTWTTLENKDIYNPDLQNIVNSFEAL